MIKEIPKHRAQLEILNFWRTQYINARAKEQDTLEFFFDIWFEFLALKDFCQEGTEGGGDHMSHEKTLEFINFLEEALVFNLRSKYQSIMLDILKMANEEEKDEEY